MRFGSVRCPDFDYLSISQRFLQLDDVPVGACAQATIANFSVDMVGKVDWSRPFWQLYYISFWSKHIDRVF